MAVAAVEMAGCSCGLECLCRYCRPGVPMAVAAVELAGLECRWPLLLWRYAELEYLGAAAVVAEPGVLIVGPGLERPAVAKLLRLSDFRHPSSGGCAPKLGWNVQVGVADWLVCGSP